MPPSVVTRMSSFRGKHMSTMRAAVFGLGIGLACLAGVLGCLSTPSDQPYRVAYDLIRPGQSEADVLQRVPEDIRPASSDEVRGTLSFDWEGLVDGERRHVRLEGNRGPADEPVEPT